MGLAARSWADAAGPTIRPECRYPDLRGSRSSWLGTVWTTLRGLIAR